jgi:hypothetical protein
MSRIGKSIKTENRFKGWGLGRSGSEMVVTVNRYGLLLGKTKLF